VEAVHFLSADQLFEESGGLIVRTTRIKTRLHALSAYSFYRNISLSPRTPRDVYVSVAGYRVTSRAGYAELISYYGACAYKSLYTVFQKSSSPSSYR